MNRTHRNWTVPVSGALLLATGVSAETDLQTFLNSTNRVSVSLRYGLNISGKFKGPASINFPTSFPIAGGRHTPNGDPYNYDNGYVLTDISGNAGNQTWYWGYDDSSQVDMGNNTISFDRTTAPGSMPGGSGDAHDDSDHLGFEVAYSYEIGMKERWHGFRYGIEAAINWMPIKFSGNYARSVMLTHVTDTYSFTPGTTPPGFDVPSELPYQGTFEGPNFVINVPPISHVTSLVPGGDFIIQQKFDADLWGIRLGPYVEMPLTKHLSVRVAGGLAVGLLDGDASWSETYRRPGFPAVGRVGGGDDTDFLYGYYVGAEAAYQFNKRWSVLAGVQFQDIGVYDHNFNGRSAEVDLSESLFVHAGISFSF